MKMNGDQVFGNLTILLLMTKNTVTFHSEYKNLLEEFREVMINESYGT